MREEKRERECRRKRIESLASNLSLFLSFFSLSSPSGDQSTPQHRPSWPESSATSLRRKRRGPGASTAIASEEVIERRKFGKKKEVEVKMKRRAKSSFALFSLPSLSFLFFLLFLSSPFNREKKPITLSTRPLHGLSQHARCSSERARAAESERKKELACAAERQLHRRQCPLRTSSTGAKGPLPPGPRSSTRRARVRGSTTSSKRYS